VSPDFIGQLRSWVTPHPEPDQLIAMRIHGVTPDFITGPAIAWMKNLSVDKLVSLRIHGIDVSARRSSAQAGALQDLTRLPSEFSSHASEHRPTKGHQCLNSAG